MYFSPKSNNVCCNISYKNMYGLLYKTNISDFDNLFSKLKFNFFLTMWLFWMNILWSNLSFCSVYICCAYRGRKTKRTTKTKLPLQFCMNGFTIILSQLALVSLTNRNTGRKHVNKLIRRPFVNKISMLVC